MGNSKRIAELNDQFRQNPHRHGKLVMTQGVAAKGTLFVLRCIKAIADFTAFDTSNNPHGERDFCAFEVDGEKLFFKIDYYDRRLENGSEDPSDPAQTLRVGTLMLPSEY